MDLKLKAGLVILLEVSLSALYNKCSLAERMTFLTYRILLWREWILKESKKLELFIYFFFLYQQNIQPASLHQEMPLVPTSKVTSLIADILITRVSVLVESSHWPLCRSNVTTVWLYKGDLQIKIPMLAVKWKRGCIISILRDLLNVKQSLNTTLRFLLFSFMFSLCQGALVTLRYW